eukprot:8203560-Pyramimonas_sp.AAC.1
MRPLINRRSTGAPEETKRQNSSCRVARSLRSAGPQCGFGAGSRANFAAISSADSPMHVW